MDVLVLKEQGLFLTTNARGEIPAPPGALGLYYQDTRFLSCFELRINGVVAPLLGVDDRGFMATLTYGRTTGSIEDTGDGFPRDLLVSRTRYITPPFVSPSGAAATARAPREEHTAIGTPRAEQTAAPRAEHPMAGALRERITFTSYGRAPADLSVILALAADFRDMLAVRTFSHVEMGTHQPPAMPEPDQLVMAYVGRDGIHRRAICSFAPAPATITAEERQRADGDHTAGTSAVAHFALRLEPRQSTAIELIIQPSVAGVAVAPGDAHLMHTDSFEAGRAAVAQAHQEWVERQCTEIETDDPALNAVIRRSLHDLRLLVEEHPTGPYVSAGIPWFAVPFGRDGLITGMQTLMINPHLAVGTLRYLAAHQGQHENAGRDEDPGKIMHEMRAGESVHTGMAPFGPYYGTVDATPLYLVLLGRALRWLNDDGLARELAPSARAALAWLDRYGDTDGDGFIEFRRKAGSGLANQGWKDSGDSLQFPDGRYADAPIALVEVQVYAYEARLAGAALLRRLGDEQAAVEQEAKAQALRERFNNDFWLPEERYFAQALDSHKQPVPAVTSNAGHGLWSGIVDAEKAAAVAERLLSADMCSGWGVRTLSSTYPSFNPLSYHNGSVWPHDVSLIVAGLKANGYDRAAATLFSQVVAAGSGYPDSRLPELYGGLARGDDERKPISYPVSCSPQAWAAASIFLMLQSVLGLDVDAARGVLSLRPLLPAGLGRISLRHLRVGDTTVTLDLEAGGAETWQVRCTTQAGDTQTRTVRSGESTTISYRR